MRSSTKGNTRDQTSSGSLLARLIDGARYSHYLSVVLALLLAGSGVLLWHSIEEIRVLQERRANDAVGVATRTSIRARSSHEIPKPYRPQHPPRLGGDYYRGNDERNERLFNGGYYRTATMKLRLQTNDGDDLQWNSELTEGPLMVSLTLERAHFATKSLFRDKSLTATFLTRQIPGSNSVQFDDQPIHFETVRQGEVWRARYPIAVLNAEDVADNGPAKTTRGRLYLCPEESSYGIEYTITTEKGKILPSSELWMGAIFLTGHVLAPDPSQITMAEWFGFQPIPEIVGGNTDDPVLLGITDYEDNNDSD